jgi:hypothetical protein
MNKTGKTIFNAKAQKSEGNSFFRSPFKSRNKPQKSLLSGSWFLCLFVVGLCFTTFFPLFANSTPPSFPVPPPKVIPDQKGLEQQRQQSESFLKWIDPRRATKVKSLQVHLPDFAGQVHYLVDEKKFTHVPRSSILSIPAEGKAKSFFKSEKEAKTKTFVEPETFVREHQNQFERLDAVDGRAPEVPESARDKIVILYSFGKITVPKK